jgi:ketol-acid reductoisomerase
MRQMLKEIQSGAYASAWIAENDRGLPWFNETRERERRHQIEEVGGRLRAMMPFLDPVQLPQPISV